MQFCTCIQARVALSGNGIDHYCENCGLWWDTKSGSREPISNAALQVVRAGFAREKIGRNEACPCGSGRKFKLCCLPGVPSAIAAKERMDRLANQSIDTLVNRAIENYDQQANKS